MLKAYRHAFNVCLADLETPKGIKLNADKHFYCFVAVGNNTKRAYAPSSLLPQFFKS